MAKFTVKNLREALKNLDESKEVMIINPYSCNDSPFIVEAFEQGVNWAIQQFLKDLWHPVSEKPKKGCMFLYKTMFKGYGVYKIIDKSEWKCIIKYQKATKWLYIDDLLPKQKGE